MRGWKEGSLLLATVLVLSMSACGSEVQEDGSEKKTQTQKEESTTASAEVEEAEVDSRLDYTYDTSSPDYTIKVDSESMGRGGYSGFNDRFRYRLGEDGIFVISPYYDELGNEDETDLSAIKSSADIINQMFDAGVMRAYSAGTDVESFTIESSETIVINGYDTTKNEGVINVCGEVSRKPYAVGRYVSYGLIAETGRPYFFVAMDFSEGSQNIAHMEELLDLIMPTFKDEGDTSHIQPEN